MIRPSKIRPMRGVVLLERLAGDERTKGGILIPETARDSVLCVVVAVGPGHYLSETSARRREPMLKKGDRVLVPKWGERALLEFRYRAGEGDAPEDLAFDGKELALVDEDDVSGVVEGGAP